MTEFFTWEFLASFAGCTAATALVTQFTKNLFPRLPTQWLSYFIAVIILVAATIFTVGVNAGNLAIIPFNAILISMASNGAFAAVQRVNGVKPKKN